MIAKYRVRRHNIQATCDSDDCNNPPIHWDQMKAIRKISEARNEFTFQKNNGSLFLQVCVSFIVNGYES